MDWQQLYDTADPPRKFDLRTGDAAQRSLTVTLRDTAAELVDTSGFTQLKCIIKNKPSDDDSDALGGPINGVAVGDGSGGQFTVDMTGVDITTANSRVYIIVYDDVANEYQFVTGGYCNVLERGKENNA